MRKFFFWMHLIAGLAAGLVIAVKAVTGAMLSFEPQLVRWAEKSVRVVAAPSADQKPLSAEDIVAAAKAVDPKKKVTGITMKADPTAAAMVSFGREGALYVNPYTAEVLGGESKTHDFMHVVEDIHRWFAFRPAGHPISGAGTLLFFFLALSGIYIWWPSTWTKSKVKSITLFNGSLTGKSRDWNWHNVIGFWSMPLLAVIAWTGVIMSYGWATNMLYHITGNEPPPAQPTQRMDGAKTADAAEAPPMAALNTLWAQAAAQVPTWNTISLRLPQKPGGPVTAQILEAEWTSGIPRRSQLTLNAVTAEVMKWEPFDGQNSGRKARIWARYLHTGEAAGVPGQIIGFILCIGASVLVWTGFALSWRRYSNWRAN